MNGFIGFDLEIAYPFPEDGWDKASPLGISCASAYGSYPDDARVFTPNRKDGRYADMMTSAEVCDMIDELILMNKMIVTWNGLGFDFLLMAIECVDEDYRRKVANIALNSIDPFFNMVCDLGYGIGLSKMAAALDVQGKLEGMHGSLAPYVWTGISGAPEDLSSLGVVPGTLEAQELCIEYVKQDAKATYDIYDALLAKGYVYWTTSKGSRSRYPWKPKTNIDRLLTVLEANSTPKPNTSWMDSPRTRSEYIGWALHYAD